MFRFHVVPPQVCHEGTILFSQKHLWCLGSRLGSETARERYGGDESADGTDTILPRPYYRDESADAAVTMTEETDLRTLLLPCYLQLLGWRCWGARLPRRICGRCCYHAICSCWGAGAGERDGGDESADAAVTMLFAAVGVEVLGSEMEETNLRTLLLPCYLQLLGWRCWGARLPRRICGRCCYHAICSCWGAGAGERDYRDESADAGVITMLFAAVGVQVLGSETTETNLRTLLLPCYLQLLGCRCWGARRRRRICGRCCYHAICSCWGGGAGERDGGDESADAAVAMLFAAVGVEVLGSETTETNLRTLLLPCYLQLLGWRCWGARLPRRICGRCCYHAICSCWGAGAGERDGGDESADAAVTMLFAAVGVQVPCYLQLLGWRCWGARLRRRICGRCCCHAICSCWGGGAGERDCGDESADGVVAMLFAAVGVEVLVFLNMFFIVRCFCCDSDSEWATTMVIFRPHPCDTEHPSTSKRAAVAAMTGASQGWQEKQNHRTRGEGCRGAEN